MIPRALHWIWLGSDPVPDAHQAWIDGWRAKHPQWDVRVWSAQELHPLRNQSCFDRATSLSQRSDIARYEVLSRWGGVYLDTDVECAQPIDELVRACEDAGLSAFAGEERAGLVGTAVLGAAPGHPWIEAVIRALPGSLSDHFLTMDQTGPDFLTRVTAGRHDVRIFGAEAFYPVSSTGESMPIGPSTYAVHHFAKSWADAERRRVIAAATEALEPLVPPATPIVLVSGGLDLPRQGLAVPFVERDAQDWGAPENDEQALAELARQRGRGIEWFVFLPPAFWWLELYPRLAAELRSEAEVAREDATIAAFKLRPIRPAAPGLR